MLAKGDGKTPADFFAKTLMGIAHNVQFQINSNNPRLNIFIAISHGFRCIALGLGKMFEIDVENG